jgi:hypothetical protein
LRKMFASFFSKRHILIPASYRSSLVAHHVGFSAHIRFGSLLIQLVLPPLMSAAPSFATLAPCRISGLLSKNQPSSPLIRVLIERVFLPELRPHLLICISIEASKTNMSLLFAKL